MTSFQRVIKYLAIVFAIFLSVNIISGIVFGAFSIIGACTVFNYGERIMDNEVVISKEDEKVSNLTIKLGYTSLEIKKSDKFKVETNNSKIIYKNNNGNVEIKEDYFTWRFIDRNEKAKLTVYIPEDTEIIEEIKIEAGAGVVNISNVQINNFYFRQGAGKTLIKNVKVLKSADIEGGAGKLEVEDSTINNLDLDLGVGEFTLDGSLKGNNKIEAGIGLSLIHI